MTRKASNYSQLQALNNANAKMIHGIQNNAGGARNQANRTAANSQLQTQSNSTNIMADSAGTNATVFSSKKKRDKPYQSETYRIKENMNGLTSGQQYTGLPGKMTNPKFLP